jgi:hypothetical protein
MESVNMKKDVLVEYLIPIKEVINTNSDFIIKGVAINETTTRNNVKYIGEELEKAAPSLRGKPILKDHNNAVDNIVGRITKATFDPTFRAVMFEGKIMEQKYKDMIKDGRINSVSIGAMVHEIEKSEIEGAPLIPRGIDFVELSLVAVPADPNAGFAQAMCEKFDMQESKPIEMLPIVEAPKPAEPQITIIETPKVSDNIKIKQEAKSMEEIEALKKQLAEQTALIEKINSEKVASEKAAQEAEKLKLQETLKKLEEENTALKKMQEVKSEMKGVVTTEKPKEDIYEGFSFGRSDSGKGYAMWKATESLDKSKYPRLARVGY